MAVIGIDLGTTNSLAAYWKDGKACLISDAVGNVLFPSVVSFFNENEMAVGGVAKEQLLLQPDKTVASFKRYMGTNKTYPIGDKSYKPLELSAFVLSEIKATAEHFLKEEIEEAVITVPAYFNDKQRSDTKKAAQLAGIHVERLINEPSAAALAYQMISGQTENNLVVFDFGGGTLDLSYVECFDNVIEIVAVAGDNMLGGDDVDACIYEYVCREKGLTRQDLTIEESASLHKEVEQKKRLLQQQENVEILGVELTNEKLFEICIPLFTRIKKVFLRLLEDAGVRISEIDDIIMVGGSSKLQVVSQFLTELLGKKPVVLGDTDLVVAMGAGAYAGIRQRADGIRNLIMTDVCPFTLGVETFQSKTDKKGRMCVLIERNSTLPSKTKQKLYTLQDFQEQLRVKIYQGEEYYAEENLFLGDVTIQVPRMPAGKEWIEVEFIYDINGILQVEVTNSRGEKKHVRLANQELTERELERYQTEMETIIRMKSPWENEEYVQLFEKVEQYYEESVGRRREYLSNVLDWYLYQMHSGRMKTIKKTVEEMKQIIAGLECYEEEKASLLFDGEDKFMNHSLHMKDIVDNLVKVFVEDGADETEIVFQKSTEEQMKQLQDLVGDNAKQVLEFYKEYQPVELPMFPCYLSLLNIDGIVTENTCAEPGMHLAKYGVVTIGVTVGGNVVCIDTNDVSNAGPKVLLFDSNFCYYDDEEDIIRIGYIPSSAEHLFDLSNPQKATVLSYENIQKCGHVLSESFMDFMEKLSNNYFEDIEELLD